MKPTLRQVWDPKVKGDERAIRLRVTHERQPRIYSLGGTKLITKKDFDERRTKRAKEAFEEVEPNYNQAIIIANDLGDNFTFQDFTARYHQVLYRKPADTSLFSTIVEMARAKQGIEDKTKIGYSTASNWVYKVLSQSVKTDDIDSKAVQQIIQVMKNEGKALNSIRIYMRALAAIYSYGIELGLTQNSNPFKKIKGLSLTSTRRKNASLDDDELKQILTYKPSTAQERFAKDFFILTIMLSGMNLGDILRLKNEAINEKDEIRFIRKKTSRNQDQTIIPLTKEAKRILTRYGNINKKAPNEYILPYLAGKTDTRTITNTVGRLDKRINAGLKTITEKLGIRKITTYTARHTFATIMLSKDMTVEQIQKFLGHASSITTQNYIATITTSTIEKGRSILDGILTENE
jgi:integrase